MTDLPCKTCGSYPTLPHSRYCEACRIDQVKQMQTYMQPPEIDCPCPLSPHEFVSCSGDAHQTERCDMCGQDIPHYACHWNGAFQQCEDCAILEALDPDQNGVDPIFGGTFSQGNLPIYGRGAS